MTYDAVLVGRRGLGADELRLVAPGFRDAIRWSLWAERLLAPMRDAEQSAAMPTDGLTGQKLMDAITAKGAARTKARELRGLLLLDEDADG